MSPLIAGVAAFVLSSASHASFITYYKNQENSLGQANKMHEDVKQHLVKGWDANYGRDMSSQ